MTIAVTFKENVESKFPMLVAAPHMDKIQVILATSESKIVEGGFIGTNINGVGWPIGHYSDGWSDSFKPWYGTVTISAPGVH